MAQQLMHEQSDSDHCTVITLHSYRHDGVSLTPDTQNPNSRHVIVMIKSDLQSVSMTYCISDTIS